MNKKDDGKKFAEGLKDFFTKGSLVRPVRLNKKSKQVLLDMIEEDMSSSVFYQDEDRFDQFMQSMSYLKSKLGIKSSVKVRLNVSIAAFLCFWVSDNAYHSLSGTPEFNDAMQYVTNLWNRKYAQSKLTK